MLAQNRGLLSYILFTGSLLGWFLLHWIFLSSDPGVHIGPSRDAWTDEGIYTAQVRNFVNFGRMDIEENPTFFKTPLFGVFLVPFFYLFGTRIEVARMAILLLALLVFLYLGRKKADRPFYTIALFTAFCNIFVFTYSHLAMAEIPAILFIILGIHQLQLWPLRDSVRGKITVILQAELFFFMAFLTKAIFAYLLLYVPVVFFCWSLARFITEGSRSRQLFSFFIISLMTVLSLILVYWAVWVIPHNSWALDVWNYEVTDRFPDLADMPGTVKFWILNVYTDTLHAFHFWMFLITGGVFLLLLISGKIRTGWTGFLWAAWLVMELHKLLLTDQPPRYQLSLLVSLGFFIAYMLRNIQTAENRWIKLAAILLVSLFAGKFSGDVRWMSETKTFQLKAANDYMQQMAVREEVALGPWAGSFCWNSKVYSIPVWGDYMNDKDILTRFRPSWIITEADQDDSNRAFIRDGLQLSGGKEFLIAGYTVVVYAVKK